MIKRVVTVLVAISILLVPCSGFPVALDDEGEFGNYEIRVIRPKYFIKKNKFELGVQGSWIMNNSFVHTGMLGGSATFHFTESWAVEGGAAIGLSLDKSDKEILLDEFHIKTEVVRTFYTAAAAVLYTPAYGKLQLPGGRLIYFDTFIQLGGGMTGIDWKYSEFCHSTENQEVKGDTIGSYPGVILGVGQRIFYSKTNAVRWDLKWNRFGYSQGDAACSPNVTGGDTKWHDNILINVGWSQFL